MNDILAQMHYLPIGILCGFVLTGIHVLGNNVKQNWIDWKKTIVGFFFITYVVMVLFIALFSREPGSRDMLSLVPFSTFGTTAQSHAYVIENIMMFIPFGCLLPVISERMKSPKYCLLMAFVSSLSIEVTQVITKMGYGQVDDVMTNVLGAAVGFLVFWLLEKVRILSKKWVTETE